MSYFSFPQNCPSADVSTTSKVVIDKVRIDTSDEWVKADNLLHLLHLLSYHKPQQIIDALQENKREYFFLVVNAGQHRAKVKHLFNDLEKVLEKNPDVQNHPLQVMRMQEAKDPSNLPRFSTAAWLNTTTTTIAVGLPAGVSS